MQVKLGCKLAYLIQEPTSFVFNIEAQRLGSQQIESETLRLTPDLPIDRWTMPESGNRYFRVSAPPGDLVVEYMAQVKLTSALDEPAAVSEIELADMPLSVFPHLYPSRYCQSDKLERFAKSTFGALDAGYDRVNGICNWINDYVAYEGGVSDAMTSAFDTVTQRAGVCRDFSHLAIALCRTLGIPARYVSGYAAKLDPPDFHAVFEAFLTGPDGGAWYLFDPTRKADPAGIVRIGLGRDAAEVAFCSPYGVVQFEKPDVWIQELGEIIQTTTQAVRLIGQVRVLESWQCRRKEGFLRRRKHDRVCGFSPYWLRASIASQPIIR